MGEKLEIMAIQMQLKVLWRLKMILLFLSIHPPKYVLNGAVATVLNGISLERIILEITEHAPIHNCIDFRKALQPLLKKGLPLAIDDASSGYFSFQHVLELEADIIKLDISLIQYITSNKRKHLFPKVLCSLSKQ